MSQPFTIKQNLDTQKSIVAAIGGATEFLSWATERVDSPVDEGTLSSRVIPNQQDRDLLAWSQQAQPEALRYFHQTFRE